MKLTKKQKVAILITLTLVALAYLFREKIKSILPVKEEPSGSDTQTPSTGGETPAPAENGGSGGNSGNTNSQVSCSSNCCGNQCAEVAENNPASNYGCCGIAVKNWQEYLNSVVPPSYHPLIAEDGAYGPATQAKHEAYLNMMPNTGMDIVAGIYENGSGS